MGLREKVGGLVQRALGRSDIWFQGDLYMRRWRLVHNRWFGVRVHNVVRSDADRELHDHPFTFVSLILAGGYWEHTPDGRRTWYRPGSVVFRSADALHRLDLHKSEAWTLVVRGPLRRTWGFLADDGWIPWHEFVARREGVGTAAGKYATHSSI